MSNISELKFDNKNFNKHTAKGMGLLEKSLQQFGAGRSILIDKNNRIIGGNGVVEAAGNIGLEDVQIVESDGKKIIAVKRTDIDLDSAEGRELAMADNAVASEDLSWDKGNIDEVSEQFGIDPGDWISDWDSQAEEEVVEDEAPEVDESEPAKSELNKVYQLGNHRLMCGDSTDAGSVAILMDGEKADMVFTDPPYGVSYTGGLQFKDGRVEKNNREMIKNDDTDIYNEVFRILSEITNGACYIWFAGTRAKTLYNAAEKYGSIHALLVWVKNGGYGALNANYKQKHEPCLYWCPKGGKLDFCGKSTETTVWDIDKDGVNTYHPTQKPVALSAKAIRNHNSKSVVDLFGGSGSTLIACEQLGRKCYVMELDPKYCDVIRKRYWKFTHDGNEEGWEEGTPAI